MTNIPYKWKAFVTVAFGTFLSTLDAGIITIAFPELTRVFHTDLTTVMWITVVFILVSSGLMLTFGKLSDSVGSKRIYAYGLVIFTVGMTACSLARSVGQIILFRVVQAVGAAMAVGCSNAIITGAFPGGERGKGLGLLSVAISLGFILGPSTGGFLLEWFDWRAIFYLRIPFGILAALIAFLLLRQDPVRPGRIRLDLWGTITSFAGLLLLLLGMGQVKGRGLMSAVVIGLVAAGLLLLVLFLIIEKRAEEPILSFELFRNRAFTFSLSGLFLYFMTVPPVYALIMPFYFMESIHMPPRTAGLVLSVIPAVNMIASPVSGFLSDRFGPKRLSSLGAAMMTAAFCLMFRFGPHTGIGEVVPVLILLGAGMGIFLPPNSSAIMGGVDKERLGSASALIGTSRQVACAIGMTVMGAVFSAGREASDRLREATVSAFLDVALVTAFLMAAVLILSLAAPGRAPRQKAHEIASEPDSTQAGRDIRA